MIFKPLELAGAYLIKPEMHEDNRGFFARSFCKQEFQDHGLVTEFVQSNISFNTKMGTLRGMHYQLSPHQETKLVRCSRGAIYDVIVDIRKNSPTYKKWLAVELNEQNQSILYVPSGFAHGFLTLLDDSEVLYQISTYYAPDFAEGFCWNDSNFLIRWVKPILHISEKDRSYTNYGE